MATGYILEKIDEILRRLEKIENEHNITKIETKNVGVQTHNIIAPIEKKYPFKDFVNGYGTNP